MKEQEAQVFKSGAASEYVGAFTQIPYSAMKALADIFAEGQKKYGRSNWLQGVGDKEYQDDRASHAIRHLMLWANGDRSEAHLSKVMWFCATQIELERREASTRQESWDANGVDHSEAANAES